MEEWSKQWSDKQKSEPVNKVKAELKQTIETPSDSITPSAAHRS
jgi:hypothetical protein